MNRPAHTSDSPPALLRLLDAITDWTGRGVAWLTLAMVVVTCVVVILRRFFGIGSIAAQESVTYMHAAVFLLGAGYALLYGEQVRVDIFYRRFNARAKAWVDALGSVVFLLPFCLFVAGISYSFVLGSWQVGEISTDAGGLAFVYLFKSLILVFAASLFIAGLAQLLRALCVLVQGDARG